MAACMTGKTETVEMLLEAGADVSVAALDGQTALSLTKAAGADGKISEAEEKAVTRLLEEGVSERKLRAGERVTISGLSGQPISTAGRRSLFAYIQKDGTASVGSSTRLLPSRAKILSAAPSTIAARPAFHSWSRATSRLCCSMARHARAQRSFATGI